MKTHLFDGEIGELTDARGEAHPVPDVIIEAALSTGDADVVHAWAVKVGIMHPDDTLVTMHVVHESELCAVA